MKPSKNSIASSIVTTLYAWNDVLWSLACVFLVLVAVEQHKKANDSATRAGNVSIYVEWQYGQDIDVDTWLDYPGCGKCPLYYSNLQGVNGWIGRDDKGTEDSQANSENASLYDLQAGEYTVNLYAFSNHSGAKYPALVFVQIKSVNNNGVATTIYEGNVVLNEQGQELTVIRWTMNEKGVVVGRSTLPKPLVDYEKVKGGMTHGSD